MNNVQEIQTKITELSKRFEAEYELVKSNMRDISYRLNEINTSTDDYTFTKDEIHVFVKHLHEGFLKSLKYNLTDLNIDEDCIELSMYDRTIDVEINTDRIIDEVINCVDIDLDRNSVEDTVNSIYKNIKS